MNTQDNKTKLVLSVRDFTAFLGKLGIKACITRRSLGNMKHVTLYGFFMSTSDRYVAKMRKHDL